MRKLGSLALLGLSALVGCGGAAPRALAVAPERGTLAGDGLQHDCMEKARDAWARREPSSGQDRALSLLAMPHERQEGVAAPLDERTIERAREDLSTTLRIRRALLSESRLSVAAKSVKIVTRDGKVTLRGALDDPAERNAVETIARGVAGEDNVQSRF